jgi:hypothetical protein
MPEHRRIIIMAFATGIIAGLAATLSIEWMRYLLVVLIGVVAAFFWQLNEAREEAERQVIRVISHHLNNSLGIMMNRQFLDPNAREQIVDDQLRRCVWAIETILPALKLRLPDLLKIGRHRDQAEWNPEWMESNDESLGHPPPTVQ